MMHASTDVQPPLSSRRPIAWSALGEALTEVLVHRGLVRATGPLEWSQLDRVAIDLARVQQNLEVVASRCGTETSAALRMAVARVYRWAIDVATHLADLEVASLDRVVTSDESEAFARQATAAFVCTVEPAFVEAQRAGGGDDQALLWDVETLRIAVERALFGIYEIG